MNITSGASCATPFWQTADIRLAVVTGEGSPGRQSLSVLLSCGTRVSARCPANVRAERGAAVQVERRDDGWHIQRCLEPLAAEHPAPEVAR